MTKQCQAFSRYRKWSNLPRNIGHWHGFRCSGSMGSQDISCDRVKYIGNFRTRHFRLATPLTVTILNENNSCCMMYAHKQNLWHTKTVILDCRMSDMCCLHKGYLRDIYHGPVRCYQWYQLSVNSCAMHCTCVKTRIPQLYLQRYGEIKPLGILSYDVRRCLGFRHRYVIVL